MIEDIGQNRESQVVDRETWSGAGLESLPPDPKLWTFTEELYSSIKLKILSLFACEVEDGLILDDLTEELTDFIWKKINSCPKLQLVVDSDCKTSPGAKFEPINPPVYVSHLEPSVHQFEDILTVIIPLDWADQPIVVNSSSSGWEVVVCDDSEE